jgi:hypothetical protein
VIAGLALLAAVLLAMAVLFGIELRRDYTRDGEVRWYMYVGATGICACVLAALANGLYRLTEASVFRSITWTAMSVGLTSLGALLWARRRAARRIN